MSDEEEFPPPGCVFGFYIPKWMKNSIPVTLVDGVALRLVQTISGALAIAVPSGDIQAGTISNLYDAQYAMGLPPDLAWLTVDEWLVLDD